MITCACLRTLTVLVASYDGAQPAQVEEMLRLLRQHAARGSGHPVAVRVCAHECTMGLLA